MTDALFDIPAPWDAYLIAVEERAGRQIADGHTIDMLYTLYLGNVPAAEAAESVGGLEHASHAVARVLANLRPEDTMRVDLKPDPQTRFRGHAQAPRAALAGRKCSRRTEWPLALVIWASGIGISLLIALAMRSGG